MPSFASRSVGSIAKCLLEQLLGFGRTLRLEEKLPPPGTQVGAARVGLDRCPECGVGGREVVKSPGCLGADGRVGGDDQLPVARPRFLAA